MERTKERSSFRKKFIGDRKFYMMVLAVAVPIMIQNGITNFVSLLDNIMIQYKDSCQALFPGIFVQHFCTEISFLFYDSA